MQFGRASNLRKHAEEKHGGRLHEHKYHPHEWIPLVLGFLFTLATQMRFVSPDCLLAYCHATGLTRRDNQRGDLETLALREFTNILTCTPGLTSQCSFNTLLDFHVLSHILPANPSTLLIPPQATNPFGVPLGSVGQRLVVDAHFHLDATLKRERLSTFSELAGRWSSVADYQLVASVNNCCFRPRNSSSAAAGTHHSYGCHPKLVTANFDIPDAVEEVQSLVVSNPRTVAVGEIGLDYHHRTTPKLRRAQRDLFTSLLRLAVRQNLPVVIHCRGYGTGSADADCLEILREVVPQFYPLHFHCFCSSISSFHSFSSSFPNSIFGITSKISDTLLHELLTLLPLHRVVLESDAPFINKTPFDLSPTIERIAACLQLDPALVMSATACTAIRFYRLQPLS